MIEMFFAVTVFMLLAGALGLVFFSVPWWLSVLVVAAAGLLLEWLVSRHAAALDEEAD